MAYTDIHALLQLAINLETTHAENVHLDANPPRFLTVEYAGITDQPAPGNVGHALFTGEDELADNAAALEELYPVTGASGRTYDLVDARVPRRGGARPERGRSPTRRWNQQSGYHEQVGSRGSGSVDQTTSSAANPYRKSSDSRSVASDRSMSMDSDRRRTNVRNAISSFRDRRSASHQRRPGFERSPRPGFERSPSSAPFNRNRSAESSEISVRTVPPVHQRRPWLPTGAYAAVNEIVAKSDEALKAPTDATNHKPSRIIENP